MAFQDTINYIDIDTDKKTITIRGSGKAKEFKTTRCSFCGQESKTKLCPHCGYEEL